MDAASPDSLQIPYSSASVERDEQRQLEGLSGLSAAALLVEADGASVGLMAQEFAAVLLHLGRKHNFGLPPEVTATRTQVAAFWRALQLQDLAIAHACALGREAAWQLFLARFREPVTQAAIGVAGSVGEGRDLADSLWAELFGLTERGERRQSPLAYYSGRGSLRGFLRATLAQRHVDRMRRSRRETPLPGDDVAAAPPTAGGPGAEVLRCLRQCLLDALRGLSPEERFLLSSWYLDGRTLLEISRVMGVHESTVSRRMDRLTTRLHNDLLRNLQTSGMSRAAAEEALGADPRDLDLNLRTLLRTAASTSGGPR